MYKHGMYIYILYNMQKLMYIHIFNLYTYISLWFGALQTTAEETGEVQEEDESEIDICIYV